MVHGLLSTTDDAPSSMASFNDSRCTATDDCVYSTDPLFFTCELNDVRILRVVLPNGDRVYFTVWYDEKLPPGFSVVSLIVSEIDDATRNISLTLSIANASLLDGGEIICDDTTPRSKVVACQVCGKF